MVKFLPFPQAFSGSLLAASLLTGLVPTTSWAQQTKAGPSAQVMSYFSAQGVKQGLREADVTQPAVTDFYREQNGSVTHTYLRQQVNGLEVFGALGAVHTSQAGLPVWANQTFVPNATQLAPAATPTLTAEQAVTAATVALGLPRPAGLTLVRDARPADGVEFNNGGVSEENIPVRLLYFPDPLNRSTIHLVWSVTIAQLDQQHHWQVLVDAHNGRLRYQKDYVVSEATTFQQLNARNQGQRTAAVASTAPATTAARGTTGLPNSMTVLPVPMESPLSGARANVPLSSGVNPWSPYGWQVSQAPTLTPPFFANVYSRVNAGFQLPRGNNVAAYDDSPNTGNLYSNTNSPNGGTTLDFDFPFDPALSSKRNLNAGVVNLFYWNNMLHDVMASKGFDEAAGNFQYKNFGTAGLANDLVRAEAQDGGGTNNANFSTPPDGSSGRMQMYLWDNPVRPSIIISAPASIAGTYSAGAADFGRNLVDIGPLCGNFVLVNDGVSGNGGLHGCATPYANAAAVNGNIAVIMRGGCAQLGPNRTNSSFAGKVQRAQANGAIMAVIIDSVATGTTISGMTGTDTVGLRIPALFLRGVDGAAFRQALAAGSVVTGCATGSPSYDGSLDNGIVSHEFGHGISTRLTGGPANSNCVVSGDGTNTFQTMGEGWSDFFGLWMTTGNVATTANPTGVTGRTPRHIGAYVIGNSATTGPGIRINPYTDNMAVNNHTYGIVATTRFNETHNVGEVWSTVLWDLNWQFIYRYGFNQDFLAQNGGNNKFLKLVLDGCKLQVCNPGFLDGRDAILRADSIANGGANSALIWTMFSRRGMGYSALQGIRNTAGFPTRTGIAEAFDMPPGVTPSPVLNPTVVNIVTANKPQDFTVKGSLVEAYPNPAQGQLTVRTQLSSTTPVQIALRDVVGRIAFSTTVSANEVLRGVELNTSSVAAGLYVVQVTTSTGTFSTKVQIQH
jgi:extracellular elastinolytic metalloproteinase